MGRNGLFRTIRTLSFKKYKRYNMNNLKNVMEKSIKKYTNKLKRIK